MRRKVYNKLVRDLIPEILTAKRLKPKVKTLKKRAFRKSLLLKLLEEAQELRSATKPGKNLHVQKLSMEGEIADVLEVLDAIIDEWSLNRWRIGVAQVVKARERGTFREKQFLVSAQTSKR